MARSHWKHWEPDAWFLRPGPQQSSPRKDLSAVAYNLRQWSLSHTVHKAGCLNSPSLVPDAWEFSRQPLVPKPRWKLRNTGSAFSVGSSSSSNEEGKRKAKPAKDGLICLRHMTFHLGCYQKVAHNWRWPSPTFVRAIVPMRLPTQVILICGKWTSKNQPKIGSFLR